MQKTIYIKDQALWDEIKAMTNGKSISRYLVDLHTDHVDRIANAKARDQEIADQIALIDGVSGVVL
jgi:hypothetical protein